MELTAIHAATERLRAEVHKVVVGQDRALDLLLVALLSDGHVLVEGVPGVAKTLLARAFATALGIGFGRIQFTPDLMPGDVLGTNLFNFQTNAFVLTKGPVFADVLLADEINRAPPKTQAALLQAMQERAVTIDGVTHPLPPAFMVIATQNPIEQEGTYPLPEAQLDRFLFKVDVSYPSRDEERTMVRVHGHRTATPPIAEFGIEPVTRIADLVAMRRVVAAIRLEDPIVDYVVDLVRATRGRPALLAGASPRAANMLATAARAHAAIQGRGFVIPDDVKALALAVLRHRVVLAPAAEVEGMTADAAVKRVVEEVEAPR
jgi:MoxR-like ATPase